MIDQDLAHGLSRRAKEVGSATAGDLIGSSEAKIGLMYKGGGLQGVAATAELAPRYH
jgi:hypothetical protein